MVQTFLNFNGVISEHIFFQTCVDETICDLKQINSSASFLFFKNFIEYFTISVENFGLVVLGTYFTKYYQLVGVI